MSSSLSGRYFKKLISNFISMLSGFIVTSLVPRSLGPELYGIYSYTTDVLNQLFVFLESGSSMALYNKVSQSPEDAALLKFYFRVLVGINALAVALVGALFLSGHVATFFGTIEAKYAILGLTYSSLFWLNGVYTKILDGIGETKRLENQRIYSSFLKASIVAFLFCIHKITLLNFFIFQIGLLFFLNVSFFRLIRSKYNFHQPPREDIKYAPFFISYSKPLLFYGLISTGAIITERWMLQSFSGFSQQGYFSLSNQLAGICFVFSSSLTPLFHREVAIKAHAKDYKGIYDLIGKIFPGLFYIAAFLSVFCALNSSELIRLIAGKKFEGEDLAFSLMLLYPIHQTYGQLTGSLFYATGDTKNYKNIGTLVLLVGLIATFFLLAPSEYAGLHLGFLGLALKNFFLQIVSVHILMYFAFRRIHLNIFPFIANQILILSLLTCTALGAQFLAENSGIPVLFLKVSLNVFLYFTMNFIVFWICYKNDLPLLMKHTRSHVQYFLEKIKR